MSYKHWKKGKEKQVFSIYYWYIFPQVWQVSLKSPTGHIWPRCCSFPTPGINWNWGFVEALWQVSDDGLVLEVLLMHLLNQKRSQKWGVLLNYVSFITSWMDEFMDCLAHMPFPASLVMPCGCVFWYLCAIKREVLVNSFFLFLELFMNCTDCRSKNLQTS